MRWNRWHSLAATRAALIATWAVLLTLGTVPAAHALGLPFVDIPDAGEVASDAMDSASRAIVNLVATSVASLTNEIIKVSDTVGAPQVGTSNAWFTASYRRTVAVSLYLMAIASLVAITAAGIRGKVGDMAQVVFVGIPGSVIAMMLATLGVQLALSLTDAMTAYTFRSSVSDIQTFLHDIGTVFTSADGAAQPTAALAPGLVLIIGLLLIIAQLVILAVLIIRAALIYIVTLFLPLVFAMQVWPATRHMTRKALELLAVLILSKFAIFTCFALGAGATNATLHASSGSDAVQSAIIGRSASLSSSSTRARTHFLGSWKRSPPSPNRKQTGYALGSSATLGCLALRLMQAQHGSPDLGTGVEVSAWRERSPSRHRRQPRPRVGLHSREGVRDASSWSQVPVAASSIGLKLTSSRLARTQRSKLSVSSVMPRSRCKLGFAR